MHMRTYGPQHISITLKGMLVLNYKKERILECIIGKKRNYLKLFALIWQLDTYYCTDCT